MLSPPCLWLLRSLSFFLALNNACPYSKFAHFTANQAILEATETTNWIYIVDFRIVKGVQWAVLLQALATRSIGKPSSIRISGIPTPALGAVFMIVVYGSDVFHLSR
uniref:Uncharacterized protein n=1 Tax=Nelumbo nucifera TaxID=4432 RepID=A0A822XC21_NELNU|nr:TPA_asm: hypothetical protein HUJ06_019343 [Nelumbo nucifera]